MKRFSMVAALALVAALPVASAAANAPLVDAKAPCFRWPAVDMDRDGVFDRVDHCVNTKPGCAVDAWGCDLDADHDGVCDGLDRCPDSPAGAKVNANGCSGSTAAAISPPHEEKPASPPPPARPMETQLLETGRIRLENVYFETGNANLLPESEAALERFPQLVIEVQGHTDTRGSAPYNRRLSHDRAETVRTFLLEHFQLQRDHLVAKGYGESQPETRERNDEELLRNRRVELHVRNPEALPKRVKIEN
jgi:OOP family OmpA-OmpF porin